MHVFEMVSVRNIVDSIAITVIMEAFCRYHGIYLRFLSESFALNVWLCAECGRVRRCRE